MKKQKLILYILAFIFGSLFALGLGISQIHRPVKVIGFFNLLGDWDPTLGVTVVASVVVYIILSKLFLVKLDKPLFGPKFFSPKKTVIERCVIIGPIIFGVGWGLMGMGPAPSVMNLASGTVTVFLFVFGIIAGMIVWRIVNKKYNLCP